MECRGGVLPSCAVVLHVDVQPAKRNSRVASPGLSSHASSERASSTNPVLRSAAFPRPPKPAS